VVSVILAATVEEWKNGRTVEEWKGGIWQGMHRAFASGASEQDEYRQLNGTSHVAAQGRVESVSQAIPHEVRG
jgi:hypothetical protein